MTVFYFLTIFAALPILAYCLTSKTSNKGSVMGYSILIFSFCLIVFLSKFSLFGSIQKQVLSNDIYEEINSNIKVSNTNLISISETLTLNEQKLWIESLTKKAIDLEKFVTANSLILFYDDIVSTTDDQLILFELGKMLRDAEFPKFTDSSFQISPSSEFPCLLKEGNVRIYVLNVPNIPIAEKYFVDTKDIKLVNSDSVYPGFDLAEAYRRKETIEFELMINCKKNDDTFILKNLIVLDKDRVKSVYKINLNEWLKKPQEL